MLAVARSARVSSITVAVARIRRSPGQNAGNDPLEAEVAIASGDLLLASPVHDLAAADARFEHAAALASARQARMVELEALTRLVELRRGSDREQDTRRRLRDCYDWFTEGFGTQQLVAARAVLEES